MGDASPDIDCGGRSLDDRIEDITLTREQIPDPYDPIEIDDADLRIYFQDGVQKGILLYFNRGAIAPNISFYERLLTHADFPLQIEDRDGTVLKVNYVEHE